LTIRILMKTNPKDYRYWTSLGACLAHRNRFDEAIEDYKKALAISPHDGICQNRFSMNSPITISKENQAALNQL